MMTASPSNSGLSDNARLSFGVELEFLVAYVPEDWQVDPSDPNAAKAIRGTSVHDAVWTAIQGLGLGGIGGTHRVFQDNGEAGAWGQSRDLSIRLPEGLDVRVSPYRGVWWAAIELQPPAFW